MPLARITTGTLIGNREVTTAFAIKATAGTRLQYWDAPKRLEKEVSEPLDEVGKCEVEDNRNEGRTVEAEVEPGPRSTKITKCH